MQGIYQGLSFKRPYRVEVLGDGLAVGDPTHVTAWLYTAVV